jgi:hypothetical protein
MARDRRDKVPELIRAAKRARDHDTALLLLEKARQIDPENLEPYLLRADIFEQRGEEDRLLAELRAALAVDPTAWEVRFRLLDLEYPRSRNLAMAAGIIRDLAWQRRFSPRLFNASRGALRSESELGFDQAVLERLAAGGAERLAASAVAAGPEGDAVLLVSSEPWLLRLAADGALRFGVDLWMAPEARGIERPADIATAADGTIYVADAFARTIRRFSEDGAYRGTLTAPLRAPPFAIACAPGGEVLVLDEDGILLGFDAGGKPVRKAGPVCGPGGRPLGGAGGCGLAAGPAGEAYVVGPGVSFVATLRRGAAPDVVSVRRTSQAKKPPSVRTRRSRGPRGGAAADAAGETVFAVDAGRRRVVRVELATGRVIERIGPALPGGDLRLVRPADVAVLGGGGLAVADAGAGRLLVRDPGGRWAKLWSVETPAGGEGS